MKDHKLVAAIDAGTTGVRCCIFNLQGEMVSGGYFPTPTFYPRPGLVEQDAATVIELAFQATKQAITSSDIHPEDIAALCITHQRNTFVPIDARGNFLTKMFIWQDQRGDAVHSWMLDRLREHRLSFEDFYQTNGQPFGNFQCGYKAIWFRLFMEDIYEKTWKLVTPHAFLTHAFGAEDFVDENNDISSWLVADADSQTIDEQFCKIFDLNPDKFAKAVPPGTQVGTVSEEASKRSGLLQGTPIIAGSGDQQCGSLGAGNYGTPDIVLVSMGTAGLCIAYSPEPIRHPTAKCHVQGHPAGGYTIEGHSSSCMSSFSWAKELFFDQNVSSQKELYSHISQLASRSPLGAKGVLFLPFLQGAACPYYDDLARGAYVGMSLATQKGDMLRATMEGISFETKMMLETLLESDITPAKNLRLIGGASNNIFSNQMQADIYGLPVETITAGETTALGAAIIGAVSAGLFPSYREAVREMTHVLQRYEPDPKIAAAYREVYTVWSECYQDLSRGTYKSIAELQNKEA